LSTPADVDEYTEYVGMPILVAVVTGTVTVDDITIPDVVLDNDIYDPALNALKLSTPDVIPANVGNNGLPILVALMRTLVAEIFTPVGEVIILM
jgi:hypothetical protein